MALILRTGTKVELLEEVRLIHLKPVLHVLNKDEWGKWGHLEVIAP